MRPSEPEFLSQGAPGPVATRRNRRKLVALGGAALAVIGVVAAGAWGIGQFMGGGQAPDIAVPASAVAYVAVDLDPSLGQKVEALKTLRKVPSLEKELGVDGRDDVRRWVFEEFLSETSCKELDYAKDVEPWLGDRMAFAAVPDGADSLTPFVVLEVDDVDAVKAVVSRIGDCVDTDLAVAFVDSYAVLGAKGKVAGIAADAKREPLSADEEYTGWMDQVGSGGVLSAYVAKE
jgi:hypothetical protein